MIKKGIQIVVGLILLGVFVNMFLHQIEGKADEVIETLLGLADQGLHHWYWLLMSVMCFWLSLMVRAHRWQVMLGRKQITWLGFRSIALAYACQIVISKFGEVIRITNQRKYTRLPYGRLVSTLMVDRLLDVMIFVVLIVIALLIGKEEIAAHFPRVNEMLPKLVAAMLLGFVGIMIAPLFNKATSRFIKKMPWLSDGLREKLCGFIERFDEGLAAARSPATLLYLFFSSFAIWVLYFLILYFLLFYLKELQAIDFGALKIFFVFSWGTIGMLVPAPGAVSYQYFAKLAFDVMGIQNESLSIALSLYAFLVAIWGVTLVMGVGSFMYQIVFTREDEYRIEKVASERD